MSSDKGAGKDAGGRIRPTDKLIKRPVVQAIMGEMSTSSLYEDPELMALRIAVGPHTVRWIEREIYETRARRVARSEERADAIRAQVEEQRERPALDSAKRSPPPAVNTPPKTVKPRLGPGLSVSMEESKPDVASAGGSKARASDAT